MDTAPLLPTGAPCKGSFQASWVGVCHHALICIRTICVALDVRPRSRPKGRRPRGLQCRIRGEPGKKAERCDSTPLSVAGFSAWSSSGWTVASSRLKRQDNSTTQVSNSEKACQRPSASRPKRSKPSRSLDRMVRSLTAPAQASTSNRNAATQES